MNSTRAYARHFFKSKLTVVYGNTTEKFTSLL